ncbi:NADP-dependent oxidoreductase [Brucella pituitosa]|uniref:NADP-dependent oxidoreductase n=1 Tax=Brucella pituitosa TaxID=571256 RepID=UPI003C70E7CF
MKAIRFHKFGGAENLREDVVDIPVPQAEQVRVRLAGTSINPVDFKVREGDVPYVNESMLPYTGGRDIAGWVEAVGEGVTRVTIGDAVIGLPDFDHGTFAQYCLVAQDALTPAPKTIPLSKAGAIPLAALTAWQGLTLHGELRMGQSVFIHGGAGGTGHFAVQFAKILGARVTVTASARDREFLLDLGADNVLDYRSDRFEDLGERFDLVLDLVGGEVTARSWAVLNPGGRLISALNTPDHVASGGMRHLGASFMTMPDRDHLAHIVDMIDNGKVRVVISEVFALKDVAYAQKRLRNGGVRGKIAIEIPSA